MFTTAVFWGAEHAETQRPNHECVIWKEVYGRWDFFASTSADEAEMRVHIDSTLSGLDRSHYKVTQG